MTNDPFNFTSNLYKNAIGFDSIFDRLREASEAMPKIPAYPPYNIKKISEIGRAHV